jgi:hypothetical protein
MSDSAPGAVVDFGGALGKRVCVSLSGERSERTHLSPMVGEVLLRCAASCERALIDYRTVAGGTLTGRELFGDLLRAIATVRTAADLLDEADSRRELALRLTVDACGAAAARCRQAGLDESILRCAAACERAADEAELVLTAIAHDAPDHS